MRVLEWFRKLDVAQGKLRGQGIRIRNAKVSVPTGRRFSLVVGKRSYTNALKHDHRTAAAHNAEEGVISRLLIRDVKPELITIERKRCCAVMHDEERRDAGDFRFGHVSSHPFSSAERTSSASAAAPIPLHPRGTRIAAGVGCSC